MFAPNSVTLSTRNQAYEANHTYSLDMFNRSHGSSPNPRLHSDTQRTNS